MSTAARTRSALASLGLAVGLALGAATVSANTAEHVTDFERGATVTTGCVIRFYYAGPTIHENGAHACTGATAVYVQPNGSMRIEQTRSAPVVSVVAQADETLVRRGITAGVSGGVHVSDVTFYDDHLGRMLDLSDPADYRRLVGPYANLWISWTQVD